VTDLCCFRPGKHGRGFSFLAGALLAASGCAQRIPPPEEPGPVADRAGDFVPGDLDAVVRVDLDGARRLFGSSAVKSVMLDIVDPKKDAATADLLSSAVEHASTMVVAFRPGFSAAATDNVTIFRGDFRNVDPRRVGGDWRPPVDLGGAFQLYERPAPGRRSAPVRIYSRPSDWLVFVSGAELDSAERVIEQRVNDDHVEPPDRGVLSYAFRAEPVIVELTARFPTVAETLRGATTVSGSVAADDRGLRATIEVAFTNEADAKEAADRATALIGVLRASERLLGRLASGAHVNAMASTLVIRIELDAAGLRTVVGCVAGGAEC
jgi:hypothetical protein